ncbi:nucleoside-diphosphate-sugar epimerase [Mangrovibacterium marinum]|uniref:Nucleoside-diphosphate-sugar epimerase n=1 Tax=Mangrovibacterium marinum TaxID=1639118 RepID=A0A2T5BTS1_9BACT|nr:GDP-mannose 4,6-dehydratase [Mangrovibacterium marinum]PTN02877.1 nucleoside-diphosphate-sugar epimerase [Mangrovibacterium marinum]
MKKQLTQELQREPASNKVFITGIDGFTGKYVEQQLLGLGYEVFGTTVNKVNASQNHITCDLRNFDEIYNALNAINPNYILHFAGISYVGEMNKSLIYDVNVIGTENLLNAILIAGLEPTKVILASSATVYGNQDSAILDESMCPKPVNHYGYSKLIMEHLATTYFDKLNLIITRPFNYTGPLQDEKFLIPKIVSHFKRKESVIELGNINVAREFNHISDISNIYLSLMKCDTTGSIVNLCSGKPVYLLDIIKHLNSLAGYEISVKVNEAFVRKNEIPVLTGCTKKLYSAIDYECRMTIEGTLLDMYNS